jgi:DNA repair photolyase
MERQMPAEQFPNEYPIAIREIRSKSILSASQIYPYVINPYVGCQHACSYCYARYMKKFTGHKEPWGSFVDVKINAAELLQKEILKKKRDTVWISGVCDPYQPLEAKYKLTRNCLQILADNDWPVTVQTRSPLVLRDMDILKQAKNIEVGFSVTTADDDIRKLFEPHVPPIPERVNALAELHRSGLRTYAMIAPVLPGAESLMSMLDGVVDYILVDRMNYHYADSIYKKHRLEDRLTDGYFSWASQKIISDCQRFGVECTIVC